MSMQKNTNSKLILAVDIGNTNTVIGIIKKREIIASWRIPTNTSTTSDEMAVILKGLFSLASLKLKDIQGMIISCVVPPLSSIWQNLSNQYLGLQALTIRPDSPIGIKISYKRPFEVGSDRLVNSLAAFELYSTSVIVVDYGTATTFDCISDNGEYLGGAISPGIMTSTEALFLNASKLPKVDLSTPISCALAQDTPSAMRSGIILGFAALTDGIVKRLEEEMGGTPITIATGGLANTVARYSEKIQKVLPDLTLQGLAIAYERMSP